MTDTVDLYLGTFLILCGFVLSLLNLRRIMKKSQIKMSSVLLSENILLICIGIAFVSRSVYSMSSSNVSMEEVEEHTAELRRAGKFEVTSLHCGFISVLMSYGPLVVSMVNSFISLVIDNYLHYKMLTNVQEKDDENIVQNLSEQSRMGRHKQMNHFFHFWKKYFSYGIIVLQWVVPILIALLMYPMGATSKLSSGEGRSSRDSCMAMLNLIKERCSNETNTILNDTLNHHKYIKPPINFLEVYEYEHRDLNKTEQINTVLDNVLKIIASYNNQSDFYYTNETRSLRRPKANEMCIKICYIENQSLLLYMFLLIIISFFVPITISTIILTKIHVMQITKPNIKTYVTRELLYNILFWTPVMFDTLLSLIFCSYSSDGIRTSIFNVIANIYQTVKNFMNAKYFKENVVVPV